jgi:predicted transcriptional regulator
MATLDLFRHDFVLSIKPEYATKIIAGEKTVELRRRFPPGTVTGALAYVYATVPIQAVIGWATIADVRSMAVPQIWAEFERAACIGPDDFWQYFGNLKNGYVLVLERPRALAHPVKLSELRASLNFVPPQSYCYADESFRRLIQHA